jgi:hypothetical protein
MVGALRDFRVASQLRAAYSEIDRLVCIFAGLFGPLFFRGSSRFVAKLAHKSRHWADQTTSRA